MNVELDSYLTSAVTMALLSTWKTYSGPAIAGALSLSYVEMLLFNGVPALLSAIFGWKLDGLIRLKTQPRKVVFRPKLRKFLYNWKKYGYIIMAILAPILTGIPTYTLISKRLNQKFIVTFSFLSISILFWSTLSYFLFNTFFY
ncbi:MAG: hypothetical protein ACPG5L_07735 [Vibrio gallaecicus]|uniref:hypothetical protein n=1 Tax=Vibrio gallaecicus TaxID=552386 RepID=UPI0010C9BEDD|nr:hypothetical protein [Vibrio gallaecicus]